MKNKRVLVAMSGGVDSSLAAYLLKQQGFDVVGVTMKLFEGETASRCHPTQKRCCASRDVEDAAHVAVHIGIPHYVVNYTREFQDRVIYPFVDNYLRGLTPSPCILCNSSIKFSKLLHFAQSIGIDHMATGHYASVYYDEVTGRYLLARSRDLHKDQSYFLFGLEQEELAHTLFPLGLLRKEDVRRLAKEIEMPVAEKPESQEICFVPDGNYETFIERYVDQRPEWTRPQPGDIVDRCGQVMGRHPGIHHFTIGQRRGLRIAAENPLYVIGIDAYRNQVIVGPKSEVSAQRFFVLHCNWIAIHELRDAIDVQVRIRSRATPAPATIRPRNDVCAEIIFHEPQPAITPGQAAVFYWDSVVVGGGWIYKVDHSYHSPPIPPSSSV